MRVLSEPLGAYTPEDESYMALALELAGRGRGRTHPQPLAGCLIAQAGRSVGQGYLAGAGRVHAEAMALQTAGDQARGATAYLTLEPSWQDGKERSGSEALIAAGISRVVIAAADPDPAQGSQGIARLRLAGVRVEVGLLSEQACRLNRPYLTQRRTGRPQVSLVAAMTLDGRSATARGDTQGLLGEDARRYLHRLRDEADAVCVGVGTIHDHDPQLVSEGLALLPERGVRDPVRVVLDSLARTPVTARILSPEVLRRSDRPEVVPAPTVIAVTDLAPANRVQALQRAGAEVLRLPAADGLVPLPALLADLARWDVYHMLVEGGPQANWSFLSQGLVDDVHFVLAPKLVGGLQAPSPVGGPGAAMMANAWPVHHLSLTQLGDELLLSGDLKPPPWE